MLGKNSDFLAKCRILAKKAEFRWKCRKELPLEKYAVS